MKSLLAAGACALLLTACSPQQLAQTSNEAYLLTIVDAAAYIRENHEWRRNLRSKNREIVLAVIDACIEEARKQNFIGEREDAMSVVDWCQAYMKKNYPDLVTIEALREGKALTDELGK